MTDADQLVFSRYPDFVDQGRRLENLSWRFWQRETFVADNEEKTSPTTQTLPENIASESGISDLPELSGSVESLLDEEAVQSPPVPAQLEIARPRVQCQVSCASTRSKRERHISSDDFGKMAVSIAGDKGPLPAPRHDAPVAKKSLPVSPALERSGSNTAESKLPAKSITASKGSSQPSSQSLMRGFWPSQIPPPQTILGAAPSSDEIQESQSSPVSSKQGQSLRPIARKPVFQIGGSSEEDGCLQSAMDDEAAVDSDTDDYIDESAIDDDDDSSDWEDATEESDKSSMDNKFFQRVDSKLNLASRQSLITLMLAQNDCARTLGNHASQSMLAIPRSPLANDSSLSASPIDTDEAPLMMNGMRGPGLKPIHEHSASSCAVASHHSSQHVGDRVDRVSSTPPPLGATAEKLDRQCRPQATPFIA
ncbi:Uncharacterized protein LW94_13264 [Fusarium fujikuroi]|nr:Uncharacterized protein LW94_13264 [Fusarium fujikuroi]